MKLLLLSLLLLVGCGSMQPSCSDNPRNMQCMNAEELQRELDISE